MVSVIERKEKNVKWIENEKACFETTWEASNDIEGFQTQKTQLTRVQWPRAVENAM